MTTPSPSGPPAPLPTPFGRRILRTALLHADTYEEVEADLSSIRQASLVVFVSCIASVCGAYLRVLLGTPLPGSALPLPWHLALIGLEPVVVWLVGSAFAFMVGNSFFRGRETQTDYLEILRTTGFALAPGVLGFFAWLPPPALGLSMVALAKAWVLVACIVAIRQALDFTTGRAIGTFAVSFLLLWLVLWGMTVTPIPF